MKTIYVLLILFAFEAAAFTLPGTPSNCPQDIHKSLASQGAQLIQVTQVGTEENRETFTYHSSRKDLSKQEMIMRFSGEHEWNCEDSRGRKVAQGSAMVIKRTGTNALLRLDAHEFHNVDHETGHCYGPVNNGDFRNCYVHKIDWNGAVLTGRKYRIDVSTLRMGDYCHPDEESEPDGEDWAVVELREEIPDIVPFRLGSVSKAIPIGNKDIKVTVVGAGQSNFLNGNEPSICEGYIGYIGKSDSRSGGSSYFDTNSCSNGPGGSGSAVLIVHPGEPSEVIGITIREAKQKYNGQPYGKNNYTRDHFFSDDEAMEAIRACDIKCPKVRRTVSN